MAHRRENNTKIRTCIAAKNIIILRMIEVKKALPADGKVLFELIKGLAVHHGQLSYLKSNSEDVSRALADDTINYEAILAYCDGKAVGCLSYSINYSVWSGNHYMHIDDVFVDDAYRSQQVGKNLMINARDICKEKGLNSMKWEVELDNPRAIKFYENLGATMSAKGFVRWYVNE